MKCLGLLGGMSWESTVLYYQSINQGIRKTLGGLHSADLILRSVDFAAIEAMQVAGDWQSAEAQLVRCAQQLKAAGAQGLVLATNTMHKVAEGLEERGGLPLLHIADATAQFIKAKGYQRVALLGTAFTMEQSFYRSRLTNNFGINVLIPEPEERADIHRIIYDELCLGKVTMHSQYRYVEIAERLYRAGAEAIILGCTEICLLLTEQVTDVPLIDTTRIHADAAVNWMLEND